MKKSSLLFLSILCSAFLANAQDNQSLPLQNVQDNREIIPSYQQKQKRCWFDFQVAQFLGFNDLTSVKFASDRLPRTSSSTDFRATFNLFIIKPVVGLFCDMGAGIMPAPRDGFADPAAQATLASGIPFYTKEITKENGYQTANGHFKMTFGLFGKIPATDKMSVSPYFGIGFMTVEARACEAILKEQDSNMQYIARYQWFEPNGYEQDSADLGYLAFRLRFIRQISPKINLLFGIEHSWYFTRINFSETYTNYFNHNIVNTVEHKGNRLNMSGLSVGISF